MSQPYRLENGQIKYEIKELLKLTGYIWVTQVEDGGGGFVLSVVSIFVINGIIIFFFL